jgi:hypothetical protein
LGAAGEIFDADDFLRALEADGYLRIEDAEPTSFLGHTS